MVKEEVTGEITDDGTEDATEEVTTTQQQQPEPHEEVTDELADRIDPDGATLHDSSAHYDYPIDETISEDVGIYDEGGEDASSEETPSDESITVTDFTGKFSFIPLAVVTSSQN